jgi:glycosyltransferase involved in cell wall biosynthesis
VTDGDVLDRLDVGVPTPPAGEVQGSKMRVLIAHNAYQQRGGEDSVVDAEMSLLRQRGHEVTTFLRHNDDLDRMSKLAAVGQMFWSDPTRKELLQQLHDHRPDVIHVHNTFPLISPSLYWAADEAGVPVVQTLHNFRLHCPQAMYLRDGVLCEDCLGKVPWRGALRGCYRESKLQSTALAGMVTLHRAIGTWERKVTRYIALNEFCRNKFIEGGLPAERVLVKPNFVDFERPPAQQRSGFLFVGRLSAEKGVAVLVKALSSLSERSGLLRVAGVGPEAHLLKNVARLEALGALNSEQVRQEMSSAAALVLPSIWYENFPRTLVEAMGCGLPVIASRIGALAELVEDGVTGLLFNPGDAGDLAEKMSWIDANPEQAAAMGAMARARYEERYTAERNYQQLIAIYGEAIAAKQEK